MIMSQFNFDERLRIASHFAQENSEIILDALGISVGRNGNAKCPCPVHGGDNYGGFTWSDSKKLWACWTNHCHKEYGAGLIGLVMGVEKISIGKAVDFIFDTLKINCDNIDLNQLENTSFILKTNKKLHETPTQVFDYQQVQKLDHKVEYFHKRNFNYETLDKFMAFQCEKTGHNLNGRACLPILDENNQVVGFTGRVIDDKKISPYCSKWLHFPYELKKEKILYGLNWNKEAIAKDKIATLVEGPLDMWKLYENGVETVVAILGNYISEYQIQLLINLGVTTLVPLFDPDEGGKIALQSVINKGGIYFRIDDSIQKTLVTDPGEMSPEEIQEIIKKPLEKIAQTNYNKYTLCKQK